MQKLIITIIGFFLVACAAVRININSPWSETTDQQLFKLAGSRHTTPAKPPIKEKHGIKIHNNR